MLRTLCVLLSDPCSDYYNKELLGNYSRLLWHEAIRKAGFQRFEGNGMARELYDSVDAHETDCVLFADENAPCLNAATYRMLASTGKEQLAAVLAADMRTPLAMALPLAKLDVLKVLEYNVSLPALWDLFSQANEPVKIVHAQGPEANVLLRDNESFLAAYRYLRKAIVQRHIRDGVMILDPENTVIEAYVQIGKGTTLYAGNLLQGNTVIGENCVLYSNNRIKDAVVQDGVTVENSVLLECHVGNNTTVGPFAYLRPGTHVGEGCRVGDFVELKNSSIGNGTKVSHLTYVGDSDLGEHINLGCGVVFVNYDGKVKNRSTVEDNAFIGCNCNLIAPVHIGKNAYLAAGSTVVNDVPEDALFVARSRGVVKEDWVKRRKEQGKL